MKAKVINTVPVKWVFKSKEEADGLIFLESINAARLYMQAPGFDFTESLFTVASDTSIRILQAIQCTSQITY